MAGWTKSNNNIASGGHQNTLEGNRDAFLVKFNASGVRQWATYYGGSNEDYGYSCALDGAGNVYLAGVTLSTNNIAFGGHQGTLEGGNWGDTFLVKFNASGVRQWATYYGGTEDEWGAGGLSCAVDGSDNVYMSGETQSTTNIAFGGHQNTLGANRAGFLVKFNASGIRQWATYYGGDEIDIASSCAVDGLGNVYLTGLTNSTTNIAAGGHQNIYGGGVQDAFLAKFDGEIGTASLFNQVSNENVKINIYPNPTRGLVTLTFGEKAKREIQVYDSFGQLVYQTKSSEQQELVNLYSLSNGVYQVKVIEDHYYSVKSLIINR